MGTSNDRLLEEARASFDAGDFAGAREAAVAALADRPDDAELLRIAGRASLELDRDDAVELLEKAVAADPVDPDGWRGFGDALVFEGRLDEAGEAFKRAIELRPNDPPALVNLGHVELAAGQRDEAVAHFQRALEHDPGNVGSLRALTDVHRSESRFVDALAAAQAAAEARPDDVVAALDAAELALQLGRLDDAEAAIRLVRAADDDPEHEVYILHAMIEIEVRRERWRRALDLAVDATRVDRLGRTTDVLAFVVGQVFGEADRPAPGREQVEQALADSRAEHRRAHLEAVGI